MQDCSEMVSSLPVMRKVNRPIDDSVSLLFSRHQLRNMSARDGSSDIEPCSRWFIVRFWEIHSRGTGNDRTPVPREGDAASILKRYRDALEIVQAPERVYFDEAIGNVAKSAA
jgi:hypothetical protein